MLAASARRSLRGGRAALRLRSLRVLAPLATILVAFGLATATAAGTVYLYPDSLPRGRGMDVRIDFNPSRLLSRAETPDSLAFLLPTRWLFDTRSVANECTPAQAAAVKCPRVSWIGFGHVVAHITGYLFAIGGGGSTDAVAYMNAFLGTAQRPGDLASMVLQVQLLSANPVIDGLNRYFGTHIRKRYSMVGRIFRVRPGPYGLETSFAGFPGGITVPGVLTAAGLRTSVTRFKLLTGRVRRVKQPIVHVIHTPSASGRTTTLLIHDHVLVGYHLLTRPLPCPPSAAWPWQIRVGFPQGVQKISGTSRCLAIHYGPLG